MRNTTPLAYTAVPTVVTGCSGHVRRNQRSRCRNPCGHLRRNVGHVPGIIGHVGPEYSRATKRPVLVATREQFVQPKSFAFAFDGSRAAFKTLDLIKTSPLLAGFKALVVMAGVGSTLRTQQLDESRLALVQAGFEVETHLIAGEPNQVLPEFVASKHADLLVMGAFGHSWLKQLITGSTTSTLLRVSDVPVLILR